MPKLVLFEEWHIFHIETEFNFTEQSRQMFKTGNNAVGYTLFDDDMEILACAGVHLMWEGVAEGWIVMSVHGYKSPRTIARYTDRLFDTIMKDNSLRRIQASVSAADQRSVRFAKWLGFEDEGLMKQYGPDGGDYYRLARFA